MRVIHVTTVPEKWNEAVARLVALDRYVPPLAPVSMTPIQLSKDTAGLLSCTLVVTCCVSDPLEAA
jgi:hypothetical protein